MSAEASWGSGVARGLSAALASASGSSAPVVELVRLDSAADCVTVVYRHTFAGAPLLGIRLDRRALDEAPERVRQSTPDEVGWDLVHLGMCEPKAIDEFVAADESGVAWLRVDEWLQDIG